MKKGRLFYTIFLIILLCAFAPMALLAYFAFGLNKSALKAAFDESALRYNGRVNAQINGFIDKNKTRTETFLAMAFPSGRFEPLPGSESIYNFVSNTPDIAGLTFFGPNGAVTAYFGARASVSQEGAAQLLQKTILGRQINIGALRRNPARKQLYTTIAYPMQEGALLAEYDMQPLEAALENARIEGALTLLFSGDNFLIYSSTDALAHGATDAYADKMAQLAPLAVAGKAAAFQTKDYIGFLSINPATGWFVYTQRPYSVLNGVMAAGVKGSLFKLGFILVCAFLLAFLLAAALSGMLTRPLAAMTTSVKLIERGETQNMPPLPLPNNEIGALSMAFAKMLDSIKIKIDDMAQDRHDLEELNQSLEVRVGSRTKELRTALNEMIKKERLAAIGQMASIVSHEIKNPLAVMANAVYLIKARLGANADVKTLKNISVIEEEIKQANGIIEEILGFARSREQILTLVDLNAYIKEILSSYPVPKNIHLTTQYQQGALPVKIDTEEMKQAVRNIIGNALEVMPQGGQLIIKTRREGIKALLSIRDTGPGIPKDVQDKIFTPFFTTKARGTGLGLAVVKKAVSRNNADIVLQSEAMKGTKMTIIFNLQTNTEAL
ncbi:MAG: hypothetical protein LBR90_01215 [Elusimicrobiota bacterium]|jgi:signal transduction histidine kinase|nr:hypothetical protein [Elusimicrobiota bacterium]